MNSNFSLRDRFRCPARHRFLATVRTTFALLVLASTAAAADWTVPGDFASVQAALDSPLVVDSDRILVQPGTYSGTGWVDLDFGGKLVLLRSSTANPVDVTLDCGGSSRGFLFQNGESASARVVGIRVINGDATRGGAVLCRNASSPSFENCILRDCTAVNSGGAVYVDGGSSPSFSKCAIHSNFSVSGGGVRVTGSSSVTFDDCRLSANGASGDGGGLRVTDSSELEMHDCKLDDNLASSGGAISIEGGQHRISKSKFIGNDASVDGGALYANDGSQLNLLNSSFEENHADRDGGAVSLFQCAAILLDSCVFASSISGANTAVDQGGAVYAEDCSQLALTECHFGSSGGSNSAANDGGNLCLVRSTVSLADCLLKNGLAQALGGGAALFESTLRMTGGQIADCQAVLEGGGLYLDDSDAMVEGVALTRDWSASGGGILAENSSTLRVNDCLFTTCAADLGGGGILNRQSTLAVLDSKFMACTAVTVAGASGGGLLNVLTDEVRVVGCLFDDCRADRAGAGVLNSQSSGTFVADIFFNNSLVGGTGEGTGMCNQSASDVVVEDCRFEANTGLFGGGIHNTDSSPTILRSIFIANSVTGDGGGVNSRAVAGTCNPLIQDCRFLDNYASCLGGGLANHSGCYTQVINSIFSANDTIGLGGGLYSGGGQALVVVLNCSFSRNGSAGTSYGGGLHNDAQSHAAIHNSLFWENQDTVHSMAEAAQVYSDPAAVTLLSYTSLMNWVSIPGVGVDGLDPLFADADGADDITGTMDDDLRLGTGSGGIDAGDNLQVPAGVVLDLHGEDRFQDDPAVADSRGNGVGLIVDRGALERGQQPGCQKGVGYQGPGSMVMTICGDDLTGANSTATLSIDGATPNAEVLLLVGFTYNPTPFKGGWMVPLPPTLILRLRADSAGSWSIGVSGMDGPPVSLYLQAVEPSDSSVQFSGALELVIGT